MCARLITLAVLGSLAIGTASSTSTADVIRFTFRGEITSIEGPIPPPPQIFVGAPYVFTYVFDTTTADMEPDPQVGNYAGAIHRACVDVNGGKAAVCTGT